jgi:hypothetical protein
VRDIYPKFDTELAKVVDQALGKVSERPHDPNQDQISNQSNNP